MLVAEERVWFCALRGKGGRFVLLETIRVLSGNEDSERDRIGVVR